MNITKIIQATAQKFIRRNTAYNSYSSWFPFPMGPAKNKEQKANIKTLRRLSKTAIAGAAIEQIEDGVKALQWHVVSADGKKHTKEIEMLTHIIQRPNQNDTYDDFITQILNDMLVLDMGCFEKKKVSSSYQPLYLFPIDAETVKVIPEWDGDPTKPRYEQEVYGKPTYFLDSEIGVITKNKKTYVWTGTSPTELAWKHIQYLIGCQEYADSIASDSMPKYIVNLGEKAGDQEIQNFRNYIKNEVQGQDTLAMVGTTKLEAPQVSPIGDDAACLSWQKMLLQIISVCYRVPPERLGSAISNDRSTTADQEENFTEHTVKPWAKLIEGAINKHVVELLGLQGKVRFEYIFSPTEAQKTALKDRCVDMFNSNLITFNEARRAMQGVLPIELPDISNGDIRLSEYQASLQMLTQSTNNDSDNKTDQDKGGEKDGKSKES